MLEQLGLGVVLSLEDDFTEKSNEALQAFDRLQSGAENMVSKLQNQMLNMRNLMMTGFTFKELGESVENTGKRMLGTLEDMGKGFIKVNASYQTAQAQLLTSFHGSSEEASKAFDWIRQYSATTPFEVSGLVTAFQKLKSSGIDMRDSFSDAKGQVKTLAEAIGDLSTRNMGGTGGVSGMGYAIQEAWAGQFRSLIQRFDIAKADLEGMKQYAGTDAKKFSEEFIKVAEKYAPDAMKNMGGTWEQTMSNMSDSWNNFVYDLGSTGVFNTINKALESIQQTLGNMFSDKKLVAGLGEALSDLIQPVLWMAKGVAVLISQMAHFTSLHPIIAKIALGFMGIAGAVFTVTGFLVKMFGSALLALSSLSILILNMRLMEAQGLTLIGMFSGLGEVLGSFIAKLGLLGVAGAGIFIAWQNDFLGLRTEVSEVFNGIVSGWQVAQKALKDNGIREALLGGGDQLQMKYHIKMPPLAKMFGEKFLKIIAIGKAFWQVFTGVFDNGVMHFSKKDWDLYKSVGIDGLVQGMVYAKEKVDMFFKGFMEGLQIVGGFAKEFFDLIWTPIKAVLDAIDTYNQKHPHGILSSLFFTKDGVDVDSANALASSFERLGQVVGGLIGTIVGFKVISGITSFITSPFRKLYNALFKVGAKTDEVKLKLAGLTGKDINVHMTQTGGITGGGKGTGAPKPTGIRGGIQRFQEMGLGGLGAYVSSAIFGRQITDKGIAVAKHFKDNDRTTQGIVRKDGKYSTVGAKHVDPTFYQYHLQEQLKNGEELQVKNRSRFSKMFLGQQYYAKGANGSRRDLGHFGGIMNMLRDDKNIQNRATSLFAGRTSPVRNTMDGYTHRVKVGDTAGKLGNLKGIDALRQEKMDKEWLVRNSAKRITGLANSQYNRFASVRQKAMGADYLSLANQHQRGEFNSMQDALRFKQYQKLGFDPRNLSTSERLVSSSASGNAINSMLRNQRAKNQLANSAEYNKLRASAKTGSLNQNVFRDTRQNAMSRALFGQRYYTVNKDAKGNYNQQVVARKGGIFRNPTNDMKYNTTTSTLRGWMGQTRPALAVKSAGAKVRGFKESVVSGAKTRVSSAGSRLAGSRVVGGAVSKVRSAMPAVKSFGSSAFSSIMQYSALGQMAGGMSKLGKNMNTRLKGAGFKGFKLPNVKQMYQEGGVKGVAKGAIRGTGSVVKSSGKFLFGSNITDGRGNVVGRRTGAIQRVGGTVARGAGMVGRGVGALGGLAMRALPVAMLGTMAYKGISNMGANKTADQKKKLGVGADAGNFQTGLAQMKKNVSQMNFTSMWTKFKSEAKGSFKQIAGIAKEAWTQLKPMLPQIMSEAFQGVKAMAQVAWEWIKTDGISLMGSMASGLKSLLGSAWDFIKTDGAQMFGQLVGWALVELAKLGVYIITNIPNFIMQAIELGKNIIQGLWEFTKSVFVGIASSIKEALVGAVQGMGNVIAGALSGVIRGIPTIGDPVADFLGLPKHHGGLWMSGDEHTAIIRKDETVLPPDISRQLHSILVTSSARGTGKGSSAGLSSSTSANVKAGDSISIDKVEVIVQADSLSKSDARKQALQIIDEIKKIKRGQRIRNYLDVDGTGEF